MKKTANYIIRRLSRSGMTNSEIAAKTGVCRLDVKRITAKPDEEAQTAAVKDLLDLGWGIEPLAEAFNLKDSEILSIMKKPSTNYDAS